MAIRFLCIFAAPRTGSSHLNKLLKSCPVFVAKGELFHRHMVGPHRRLEYERLREISKGAVTDGESYLQWRRKHPAETLEALYSAWGSKIITFKVFPNHIPLKLIETQLFPRKDIAFAVLRRRLIESFISTVKAKQVGIFTKTDTTDIKPEISAENFLEWARRMRSWFKWVANSLEARNEPFARIGFDKHINGRSGEDAIAHIRELLRPVGISEIGTPDEVIEGERQDKEPDYRSRIANWDAFEAELRASPQSERMLNWALRTF